MCCDFTNDLLGKANGSGYVADYTALPMLTVNAPVIGNESIEKIVRHSLDAREGPKGRFGDHCVFRGSEAL